MRLAPDVAALTATLNANRSVSTASCNRAAGARPVPPRMHAVLAIAFQPLPPAIEQGPRAM